MRTLESCRNRVSLLFGIPPHRLGGTARGDPGERRDENENRCATKPDEVEPGDGPRAEDADQQRDARDETQRRQAQRGAIVRDPSLIAAHRRRSPDPHPLIAPEMALHRRPVDRDEQSGQI